ncbi:MAG: family 1 glycosylhydrolase, partial [Angelakisella sp.]
VEPIINLHHYDLPLRLLEQGGWMQQSTVDAYGEYANIVFNRLGDRVSRWITMNDVRGTLLGGYITGKRAPGYQGMLREAVAGWHNMNLAAASAMENWHSRNHAGSQIGVVMGLMPVYPNTGNAADIELARQVELLYNDMFIAPPILGHYPREGLELLDKNGLMPSIASGKECFPPACRADFLGVSYYTPMRVQQSAPNAGTLFPGVDTVPREPRTESGWEIYPNGIYDLLMGLSKKYPRTQIYVAETGGAFPDVPDATEYVCDDDRIDFLRTHIAEIHRAMADGADVRGIHLWTLLDNFEWQQGFTKRFGLIRVNHDTLKRTPKKSYHWYSQVIARNGLE